MDKIISSKIDSFFSRFKVFRYEKGEVIIRADDTPQGVYYIKKGHVRLYYLLEDGREITLNIFKPGSYFSMMWALCDIPNTYYFQSVTPTETYRASKKEVVDFIRQNSDVLLLLTKRILIGLDGILTNIPYLFSGNACHRIMGTLVMLAKRFGYKKNDNTIIITLPLTHRDIASLSGMTRETTSIEMKKLEKRKLIFYNADRLLVIGNIEKLKEDLSSYKEESDMPHIA